MILVDQDIGKQQFRLNSLFGLNFEFKPNPTQKLFEFEFKFDLNLNSVDWFESQMGFEI